MVIPILLAVDFGGVYHWSQYAAAIGIVVAVVFALPGLSDNTCSSGIRQHAILLPLGLLASWAWLQSCSLPEGFVGWLSPGVDAAYTQWLTGLEAAPAENSAAASGSRALSISPADTAHVAMILTLMLPLCWGASIVFHARSRLQMLLSAIAIAGASVAVLGFYRKLDPTADLWIFQPKASSFGGFVNRNNAALMMNLGLAASLGLLSWRMMALHHIELDDPDFEFNDLFALVSDRDSLVGLLSGTACIAGVLVNGSRGGLVAALFGIVLAFGYVRPQRGLISLPILIVVLAISVVILITPMNLNLETIQRWELFSPDADTLQSDGRLLHWQDGWQAAIAYLPGGSGVSTYAYAYLPYQDVSPGSWFEHADNFWLEMLVETGIVGVIVAVWLSVLLFIAMNHLSYSVDPLDQGLRVAGWYAIGAIFVSQIFDNGMILPANFIAAALLCTAIVSRNIANGGASVRPAEHQPHVMYDAESPYVDEYGEDADNDEDLTDQSSSDAQSAGGKIRFATRQKMAFARSGSWANRLGPIGIAITAVVAGVCLLPGLKQDAISNSMLARLDDEYANWQLNPKSLEKMEAVVKRRIELDDSPQLMMQLATIQRDRARLAETREWSPKSAEETLAIFRQTDLFKRDLPYPPRVATQQSETLESLAHYRDAWQTSLKTLATCPLAQEPRGSLIRLYPIIASPEVIATSELSQIDQIATTAADQLYIFYRGDATRLFALGEVSLDRGDIEASRKAFFAAIELEPNMTSAVMEHVRRTPELKVALTIPNESRAMQIAVADYLRWDSPDPAFLQRATETIRCGEGDSMAQRANCHALVGRVYFQLENVEKGKDYFERAIRLAPDQANHRVELIEFLLKNDLLADARGHARQGRQSLPDDPRFQRYIDQISASERDQLIQPNARPAVDQKKLEAILKTPD